MTLEVEGVGDADPLGNEPLWQGAQMVGRATAGTYGHCIGKSLAIGYVQTGLGAPGTEFEIEILGERYPSRVIADSPHDPENARMQD